MKLVDPEDISESEFNSFVAEFKRAEERPVPYALDQGGKNFQDYIRSLNDASRGKGLPDTWPPASTFFLVGANGKIYGAVNIRHRLTDGLRIEGGHIGYGVRPSVRSSGYGTRILEFALEKARELGISKALLTCNKANTHSARIIQKNGGRLDFGGVIDGHVVQRYWMER
mgnify:CR=1 FL=1